MPDFPVLTAESLFKHAKDGLDASVQRGRGVLRQELDIVLSHIADREMPDHPHADRDDPEWWYDRHNHPEVRKAFRMLLQYAATTYDHRILPSGGIEWLSLKSPNT